MKKHEKILSVMPAGAGHYKVTIIFRNREISGIITCMPLIDTYKSVERGWKSAGNQIYNIIKSQN